jgi:uncharacterized integral membrane protein
MHYLTTGLAIVAALAITVFSIQNLGGVEVSFLIWSTTISKCVVIIGAYLLGMVSGWGLVELFKKSLQKWPCKKYCVS